MKTISLKMLFVAALVAAPAVMADDLEFQAAQTVAQEAAPLVAKAAEAAAPVVAKAGEVLAKAGEAVVPALTQAGEKIGNLAEKAIDKATAVVNNAVNPSPAPEPATSYYDKAKNAIAAAGKTIVSAAEAVAAVPGEAYTWVQANKAVATVIAAIIAKEAYTYATAPAKAKTVKTEANA